MLLALALLQTVSAQAPDIVLGARVQARRVVVRQAGEASLTVRAEPDAGSAVTVRRTPERSGQRTIRNLDVHLRAEARIGPAGEASEQETDATDPR